MYEKVWFSSTVTIQKCYEDDRAASSHVHKMAMCWFLMKTNRRCCVACNEDHVSVMDRRLTE